MVFKGRPLLVQNYRPGGFKAKGENAYLFIEDLTTGQEVARFGKGYSFVSAFVNGDEAERLRHGVHRLATKMDQGHLPLLLDRPEDVEAGAGHRAQTATSTSSTRRSAATTRAT